MPLLLRFFILSARWLAGICTRRRRLQGAVYLRLCGAAVRARSSCQRLDTAGSDKTRRSSCCASPGLTATGVRTLVPPYIRPSVPHTCLPFQKTTVADTCPPPPVTVMVSVLKLIHTATPDTTNCRRCELDSGQLKTVADRKFEV